MKQKESKTSKWIRPKYLIASGCFSVLFTVMLVAGGVIYDRDKFPTWELLKESGRQFYLSPLIFVFAWFVIYAMFLLLDSKKLKERSFLPRFTYNMFVPAALFFLLYGVVYLSYYPGTWCYDIIQQNQMILGLEELTKHHPPLHTYLWGLCLLVERLTAGKVLGIVFYSILQIIVTSLVYGRVVYSVRKVTKNDICVLLAFAYLLLNPTFALFSFSPTKDPWCALFFLLSMTFLYEWLSEAGKEKEKKEALTWVKISVCLLVSCLFRNNMIYALVLVAIVSLIIFRKYWKQILLAASIVFVGFLIVDKGIYGIMKIPDVDKKEMLSVPIQQIGRAYRDYGTSFTEEDINDIDRYIGMDKIPYYNAHISDPIKTTFKTKEFDRDKAGFISLWLRLGTRHPDSYIIAYLSQYSPYWYPRSKSFDIYSVSPYVEDYISDDKDYVFERAGYLPAVYDLYDRIAKGTGTILLSRSWPFWISLMSLFVALVLRKKKSAVIPAICFCYLLTLFLGPLCIMRYALPVLACTPLMLIPLLKRSEV